MTDEEVVSLRDHVVALIEANDMRYGQRFEAQQVATNAAFLAQQTAMQTAFTAQKVAIDAAFAAQKEAITAALASADRAVSKAEVASEKRFDSVNEFRNTLADQQRTLMPRSEAELLVRTLSDKIDLLTAEAHTKSGEKTGAREIIAYLIATVGVGAAVLFHFVH